MLLLGGGEVKDLFICSSKNSSEVAWSGNDNILVAGNLIELVNHFKGSQVLTLPEAKLQDEPINYPDFKDIKGQKIAKRTLEIAASGGHNLLMFGPPGTGKSRLAACLPSILPKMSTKEILECSTITSIAGKFLDGKLTKARPFRTPHHSFMLTCRYGRGRRCRKKSKAWGNYASS